MKRFAFISDLLFTFLASTLLALCAFRFINVGFWLSLLLAALCGGLIMASVGAHLQSKRKNLLLKRSDEQEKEKLLLHLALLSDGAKTEFFRNALSKNTPLQRFSLLRLHSETQFYFLHFKLSPVNADDVARYARLKTGKEKILLCGNIEEPARTLCGRLQIQVKTGEDVYVALKNADALPKTYLGDSAQSGKKRRLTLWFSKRNSKRFLISAALILLLSMLTPFFYYYVFMSVALLLVSVFVRIFGKSEV
ncbi:MAG: hypothetical protein IJY21_01695 [Clostridia bacterium]|nr:hypothetical protein [Clostridia bacterium]